MLHWVPGAGLETSWFEPLLVQTGEPAGATVTMGVLVLV